MTRAHPIRRIRRDGGVDLLGQYLPEERRLVLDRPGYPLQGPGEHDVEEDVPWVLQDVAPAGYLARRFARWFPECALPGDGAWSVADTVRAVTEAGHDLAGNLVVGEGSWARHLAQPAPAPIGREQYERLASDAQGEPGAQSSVGGVRPKFTLRRPDGTGLLVKFTPPLSSPFGARWLDLLRVEAHVSATLRAARVPAVRSDVVVVGDRGYLEVERYDRLPGGGRLGQVTLFWLAACRYGEASGAQAVAIARRLEAEGRLTAAEVETLALAHALSAAIGNTDAHLGNYALTVDDDGRTALAPLYDILPMVLAPQHDELPDARLGVLPGSREPAVLRLVRALVERVRSDPAIGPGFTATWLRHLGVTA